MAIKAVMRTEHGIKLFRQTIANTCARAARLAGMSEIISEDEIDTMVNIVPDNSGLPMTVWVRPCSNERYGPRIKVCTIFGPRMFPRDTVSVTLPPIRVILSGGPAAALRAVGA